MAGSTRESARRKAVSGTRAAGPENVLYFGDNLEILRSHVDSETVDLVYLDPPFNSKQDYNVLFAEKDGTRSAAQINAFNDTWRWDQGSEAAYREFVEKGGRAADALVALRGLLRQTDMMAYLAMMAPRLAELHRVLKPTGTLYLHCDPTASHYLKLILDAVFGPPNFRNEITWRRSHPKGHAFTRFARNHDTILVFAKDSSRIKWTSLFVPHDPERAAQQYSLRDPDGRRYQLTSLLNPNPNRPNLTYEYKGHTKVWRWTRERMLQAEAEGSILVPKGGKGIPRYKRYLDEQKGIPVGDFWDDIDFAAGGERIGYPTQKPEALLERIIEASSNEGDIVLDPFCGCGTAIVVSERLRRRWLGIDITHLAVGLIKNRLRDSFPEHPPTFLTVGEPESLADAEELAQQDRFQFECWILSEVGARIAGKKKGADAGIDGRQYFHDERRGTKQILFSVKSGKVSVRDVRDLRGVVEREKAEMGVLLTLEPATKPMIAEAAQAGFYDSSRYRDKYPKLQIVTVEDLFEGRELHRPPSANVTFKRARRRSRRPRRSDEHQQGDLF